MARGAVAPLQQQIATPKKENAALKAALASSSSPSLPASAQGASRRIVRASFLIITNLVIQ